MVLIGCGLDEEALAAVSELIERRMGLHFPCERHDDLARGLGRAVLDLHHPDLASWITRLLATGITREENAALARALTVGETYFFREPASLKALEESVLPELIEKRRKSGERRLRLWSAGCSTGEEAYTLAIMLTRMLPDLPDWDVTILATDINSTSLARARSGTYSEWSFRGTPSWLRRDFFSLRNPKTWVVHSRIKGMVMLSYLNLVEGSYPSLVTNTTAMDVILCRNVTMYFTAQRVRQLADRFRLSLLEGGWLVVSPSEASHHNFSKYSRVSFGDCTLFRRTRKARIRREPDRKHSDHVPVAKSRTSAKKTTLARTPAAFETKPQVPQSACRDTTAKNHQDPVLAAYDARDYRSAVRLVSESAEPGLEHLALAARASANLGHLDESLDWCEKTLLGDNLLPSSHYLHSTVLVANNNMEAARESLRRVLYLDPNFVLAHFTLANILSESGDVEKASRHLRQIIRLLGLMDAKDLVPESEGMTVGVLTDVALHLLKALSNTNEKIR